MIECVLCRPGWEPRVVKLAVRPEHHDVAIDVTTKGHEEPCMTLMMTVDEAISFNLVTIAAVARIKRFPAS